MTWCLKRESIDCDDDNVLDDIDIRIAIVVMKKE